MSDWFFPPDDKQPTDEKIEFSMPDSPAGNVEPKLEQQDDFAAFGSDPFFEDGFSLPPPRRNKRRPRKWLNAVICAAVLATAGIMALLLFRGSPPGPIPPGPSTAKLTIRPTIRPTVRTQPTPAATPRPTPAATPRPTPTATPTSTSTATSTATPTARPASLGSPESIGESWYDIRFRYYYQYLTEHEKELAAILYRGMMDFETEIQLQGSFRQKELDRVMKVIWDDTPELFQLRSITYSYDNSGIKTVMPEYRMTQAEYRSRTDRIRQVIRQIQAMPSYGSDDYAKEYAVYCYLVDHCEYLVSGEQTERADAALCLGQAQCSGYTDALSLLLRCCGVPCFGIDGDAGGAHSWNMVQIAGNWYLCDVTWDDPPGNQPALGNDRNRNFIYLNVPDWLMRNHIAEEIPWVPMPECRNTAYLYANQEGVYLPSGSSLTDAVTRTMEKYRAGLRAVLIVMENKELYAQRDALVDGIVQASGSGVSYSFGDETHSVYIEIMP